MDFEVETTYDRHTIQTFQSILNRTIRLKRIRAVRIMALLIGTANACYGWLWFWAYTAFSAGNTALFPALTAFLSGILFLFFGVFHEKIAIRLSRYFINQGPSIVRYSFQTDGYYTIVNGKRTHSSYGIIKALCMDDSCYVLMLNRQKGFLVNKSHFQIGEAEAFAVFIEAMTGKTFRQAK